MRVDDIIIGCMEEQGLHQETDREDLNQRFRMNNRESLSWFPGMAFN